MFLLKTSTMSQLEIKTDVSVMVRTRKKAAETRARGIPHAPYSQ